MAKNFLRIRRLLERAREKQNDSCRQYNLFRYIAREHELSHLMIVQFYGSARQVKSQFAIYRIIYKRKPCATIERVGKYVSHT